MLHRKKNKKKQKPSVSRHRGACPGLHRQTQVLRCENTRAGFTRLVQSVRLNQSSLTRPMRIFHPPLGGDVLPKRKWQ